MLKNSPWSLTRPKCVTRISDTAFGSLLNCSSLIRQWLALGLTFSLSLIESGRLNFCSERSPLAYFNYWCLALRASWYFFSVSKIAASRCFSSSSLISGVNFLSLDFFSSSSFYFDFLRTSIAPSILELKYIFLPWGFGVPPGYFLFPVILSSMVVSWFSIDIWAWSSSGLGRWRSISFKLGFAYFTASMLGYECSWL